MTRTQTKVSPKQWARFQKHVVYWQVLLGLQDWTIDFNLADATTCLAAGEEFRDNKGAATIAWVCSTFEHHVGTVFLREDWSQFRTGVKQDEIDKSAFHEMCHLLLSPLEQLAESGSATRLIDVEVHRLIRVLENTFYESQKKELQ